MKKSVALAVAGVLIIIVAVILAFVSSMTGTGLTFVSDGHGGLIPYTYTTWPYQGALGIAIVLFIVGGTLLAYGAAVSRESMSKPPKNEGQDGTPVSQTEPETEGFPKSSEKEINTSKPWYCQTCGRPNTSDDLFCGACGQKKR